MASMRGFILTFLALIIVPVLLRAVVYAASEPQAHWSEADRTPVGLAPAPANEDRAVIQVYAARAYRWRGIFAVHTWIALKPAGATDYTRYDVIGWGRPLRVSFGPPDGRWFGNDPELLVDVRGDAASRMIPAVEAAIASYPHDRPGGYTLWPGPNSNSFVAEIARQVPELQFAFPPHAVGKDFGPSWLSVMPTPSNSGWQISFAGYAGVAIGAVEGLELHILGQTLGLDILRPAIKLPALGRIGLDRQPA